MSKPSGFLLQMQREKEAARISQLKFTKQQCEDIAIIVLAESFGFGEKRAAEFREAFRKEFKEQVGKAIRDGKDDPEIVYTMGKIDEKLRQVLGSGFEEQEDRYEFLKRGGKK